MDFSGKTAVVTGGSRGIGRALAEWFVRCGAQVIVTGTSEKPSGSPVNGARYVPLDLADHESLERFAAFLSSPEKIDILVNNAGINVIEPITELRETHWEKVLRVNLTGPALLTKAVAKRMQERRYGRILNVSSIWGVASRAGRSAYSASKSGLIGLTRASALDLAPFNILVNALCPGFTNTELTFSILPPEEREELSRQVPLRRFAEVGEVAKAAAFLCSDWNTYITGQTVVIDGGYTIT